jgi:hypothetical protein
MWLARQYLEYLWKWLPRGKRARIYSINAMRARHPAWFQEDLERLFGMLKSRTIQPRGTERISCDDVPVALKREVSMAGSFCALTSRRRLRASRAPLRAKPHPRPERPVAARSLPCSR